MTMSQLSQPPPPIVSSPLLSEGGGEPNFSKSPLKGGKDNFQFLRGNPNRGKLKKSAEIGGGNWLKLYIYSQNYKILPIYGVLPSFSHISLMLTCN